MLLPYRCFDKEKFKERKINIEEYLKIIPLNGKIDLEIIKINLISPNTLNFRT